MTGSDQRCCLTEGMSILTNVSYSKPQPETDTRGAEALQSSASAGSIPFSITLAQHQTAFLSMAVALLLLEQVL